MLTLEENNFSRRDKKKMTCAVGIKQVDEQEVEHRLYLCCCYKGLEVVSDRLAWFSGATHWSFLWKESSRVYLRAFSRASPAPSCCWLPWIMFTACL